MDIKDSYKLPCSIFVCVHKPKALAVQEHELKACGLWAFVFAAEELRKENLRLPTLLFSRRLRLSDLFSVFFFFFFWGGGFKVSFSFALGCEGLGL